MARAPPPLLRHGAVAACEPATSTVGAPTAEQNAALADVKASPALQPREVISYMLNALHKSNLDKPKLHFGCEVALRFLAPTNPASKATPEKLAEYLGQTWYQPLLNWNEYRWEGDLTLLGENEAYQQVSTRVDANSPWVSVRWILVRVPFYGTTDQWMVNSVRHAPPSHALPCSAARHAGSQKAAHAHARVHERPCRERLFAPSASLLPLCHLPRPSSEGPAH